MSPFDLSAFDGADLVPVMVSYFDASEEGGFLTVAGYLFRKKDVRPFEKRWKAMLRGCRIDYFHMTDCNVEKGQFKDRDRTECDLCARMAIAAITDFAAQGFSVTVRTQDFHEIVTKQGFMHSPFSLCAYSVLMQCVQWAEDNDPTARMGYVFEAGDQYQSDANQLLNAIAENPTRRAFFRYEMHAFLPKRESLPTQAADILVWHVCKQAGRDARGITRLRGDFSELVEKVVTRNFYFNRAELEKTVSDMRRQTGLRHGDAIGGLSLRRTESNGPTIDRQILALLLGENNEAGSGQAARPGVTGRT